MGQNTLKNFGFFLEYTWRFVLSFFDSFFFFWVTAKGKGKLSP